MTLSRCIETRLLEAVWKETVNCFTDATRTAAGQPTIGLDATYSSNGIYRIYARPFKKNESIVPYQINIVPLPPKWTKGTGGVETTIYEFEVNFVFPWDLLNIVASANTYLDHMAALRAWLATGGSWQNKTMAIQDPDNAGHEIAHFYSFAQDHWTPAPGNAGVDVPVILGFETREDKTGVVT